MYKKPGAVRVTGGTRNVNSFKCIATITIIGLSLEGGRESCAQKVKFVIIFNVQSEISKEHRNK